MHMDGPAPSGDFWFLLVAFARCQPGEVVGTNLGIDAGPEHANGRAIQKELAEGREIGEKWFFFNLGFSFLADS